MDFTPYTEHLKYRGYSTFREDKSGATEILFAEGSPQGTLTLSKLPGSNFLLIRSNWSLGTTPTNIYQIVNTLNEQAVNISSVWFYLTSDKTPALGISSVYFGDYDRERFTSVIETFFSDVTRVLGRDEVKALSK